MTASSMPTLAIGCKINAAEQAVGHDGRDLTDLIRADDGQHGAERRQHERQNDDAEALSADRPSDCAVRL